MTVVIALLRAVNVGSHNKIRMEDLRALCQSLKLHKPQTYVQSGNVVFATKEPNLTRLAKRIEDAIEQKSGFRPDVILRTPAELRKVIAKNPFAKRKDIEPSKLIVTFLAQEPSPDAVAKVLAIKADPEELFVQGRELYVYFPTGMGRTKLPVASIGRTLKTPGTARNWNSVLKLMEMAEALEGEELQ